MDAEGATTCAGLDEPAAPAFVGVQVKAIDTNGRTTCVVTRAGKVRCEQHHPAVNPPLLNIPLGLRDV